MATIDTPEFRRLLFVAQQRRARFVALHVPIPTGENEREWDNAIAVSEEARQRVFQSAAVLLDYLQACIDQESS